VLEDIIARAETALNRERSFAQDLVYARPVTGENTPAASMLFDLNWYCMWPPMALERLFFHTALGVACLAQPSSQKLL
jgi:hypothetical protein